jgi:hypothetical protein
LGRLAFKIATLSPSLTLAKTKSTELDRKFLLCRKE